MIKESIREKEALEKNLKEFERDVEKQKVEEISVRINIFKSF